MVDIKEIKSVELAAYTKISSIIWAILAFLAAIVTLLVFGAVAALFPQAQIFAAVITAAGVATLIIYPVSTYFIVLAVNFFSAMLYNGLVPRIGGIKLGLDGSEVAKVPVVSFALILAVIEAIWAFIIGLYLAASLAPLTALLSSSIPVISQAIVNTIHAISNATNATNASNITNVTNVTLPTGAGVTAIGIIEAVFLIIALPIIVFIVGFIVNALAAIFYNYLVNKVAKFKLEFAAISGTLYELKSIPVLPAALAAGVVAAIFGFLVGLGTLATLSAHGNYLGGVLAFIYEIIRYFIMYFIIVALAAIFYNYLAPRIGGIKLDLE